MAKAKEMSVVLIAIEEQDKEIQQLSSRLAQARNRDDIIRTLVGTDSRWCVLVCPGVCVCVCVCATMMMAMMMVFVIGIKKSEICF